MKSTRQNKILELIKEYNIDKQEDLQAKLREYGLNVTQATISRDIREMGIIKSEGSDGVYKYRIAKEQDGAEGAKFSVILRQAVLSVASANNLIVVKTHTGMGSAAGAAVDTMELDGVIGTLAGDDTLLIIAHDNEKAEKITKILVNLI